MNSGGLRNGRCELRFHAGKLFGLAFRLVPGALRITCLFGCMSVLDAPSLHGFELIDASLGSWSTGLRSFFH